MAAPFTAYASRLRLVVGIASFMPILVIGAMCLVTLPGAPLALRIAGVVILAPIATWMLVLLRQIMMTEPLIEIDDRGLLWRRWSADRIPWSAFDRWAVRRRLGHQHVTLWLKEPARHRSTTVNRLLAPGNKWLGYGDITLNDGGANLDFDDLVAAIRPYAPLPPLPQDPRLARRILQRRGA